FTFATNNTLTKLGDGTLTLRGANTYAGVTNIEDGTLRVNDVADGGLVSNLGTNGVINISGAGTLSYDGTATDAMNRTINLDLSAGADSPRIDVASPTGELQLTNAIINGVGETLGKTGPGLLSLVGTTSATLANLFAAGGTLTLQDTASILVSDTTTVGADPFYFQHGGSGTLNIRDNATLTTGQLVLGENSSGPAQTNVLNQTSGTVIITSKAADTTALRIGHGANTTNTYNLSGGTLTLTDPAAQIASGGEGVGTFAQTGGSANAAGVIVNYLDANGSGVFTLTNGTFALGAGGFSTIGGPAAVNLGGAGPLLIATASSTSTVPITLSGQGASALTLDTNGHTVTLGGNITGSGALNKVGTGTLALDGTNSYVGPTIVNAGTLAGDGSLTSAVDLSSTATLAPGGSLNGDLTTGTVTFVTGSTYQAQISGVTPGTTYDQLVVNGDVHLNSATLDLSLTGVYPGATTFVLIQNDGIDAIDGTFLNLPELSVITLNGQAFRITYRYNAEAVPGELGTGNDVALVRNQAPVAQDDNYTINEGGVLNGTSVLANDSDPDGEPLLGVVLVTPPEVGSLNFNTTTGTFIYTPPTNFAGSVTFVYRARDAELFSNDATVTILVDGIADAPVITVASASGLEDTNIPLSISVVALNPATEVISSIIISNVPNMATLSHGVKLPNGTWSLTVADLAGLTIRPAAHSDVDFVMLVTATVIEGGSPPASAQQSLPVNITAVADAPLLTVPSTINGLESTNPLNAVPLGIVAQLVDTDFPFPNSETLSVRIAGVPSDATIVGGVNLGGGIWQLSAANIAGAKLLKSDNGVFTLTVTATSTETDSLATPRTATAAPKQIQVTINNDLPVPKLDDVILLGSSLGALTQIGIVPGLPLTLMVSTTDPAGKNALGNDADAPFSFILNWGDNSQPSTGTATAEGLSLPFSHNYGTNGTFTITLKVTDKDGGSRTVTLATVNAAQIVTSGDVLYVGGTNLGDRIIVSLGKGISIRINNTTHSGLDASRVVIFGNGGNDTISTTSSQLPVEFYGGAGDDYLSGGSQIDTLDGGAGRDRMFGYAADDVLLGGPGNDNIFGGAGEDYLSGDDFIDIAGGTLLPDGTRSVSGQIINLGDAGADTINGEAGHDTIMGNAGNDRLIGGVGNDYLNGGADTDNIDGGDGNDFLYGGIGSDVLYGRAGADILIGGLGTDSLYGGAVTDLLYGGNIDSSLLDPLDDTNLRAIWESWASADFETAVDWLTPYALGNNDHNRDSVHGEGDADWYLMFLAYLDVYRISTEGKTPNKTIYLDA
ncbi:MAG TPA: Ig-like domain-containing protein, partial [Pirellulaceae bacterium]|nr:Ig-like domain-containing protein [Pirellulaceae bacterium]